MFDSTDLSSLRQRRKSAREIPAKIIMGIDPGTNFTGFGIISVRDREVECIDLGFIESRNEPDIYQKLRRIFEKVTEQIEYYKPHEVAFESPFFGENVQSMLKLGRAQGVAMAAALTQGLPVFEYAPRKVKQSITGNGAASKEQVAALLKSILKVKELPHNLDSTDGLAVALCHHYESSSLGGTAGGSKNWKDFVAKNSGRIIK